MQIRTVPLPKIQDGKVSLRVAHVVNPRFPRLNDEELARLLDAAARAAELHFGVQVSYEGKPTEISPERLFSSVPDSFASNQLAVIEAWKKGPIDRSRLAKAYEETIKLNPVPIQDVITYARELDNGMQVHDVESLAAYLASRHIERIEALRAIVAADGGSLVDASPYNESLFWQVLGQAELPFDVLVTNQPIVSLEYVGPDVHSGLRGGMSIGTTFYSRAGRYGSAIVWSTFPFVSQAAAVAELRGGHSYPMDEAAALAGTLMAHEYGHLLFHLGHPFGNPACIMHPTPLLKFREQAAALDAKKCPIGISPAMRPGAIPIQYYE
jgi:hypothetical protein